MKWLKCLLALCVLVISQLVVASNSYAASDYDSVISNTSQLKLSNPGSDDMDISTTYMGYIKGTITEGVAYNDCDSLCRSIVNDSLDHGDWSINQEYSNYPSDNYRAYAQFCDQAMTSTAFSTQYWGSTRYDVLRASTVYSANCAWISIGIQSVTSGGNIFIGSNVSLGVSDGVLSVASTAKNNSGVIQYSTQPFVYTGVFDRPEGYGGQTPSATYTPPSPVLHRDYGTVDCGSLEPPAEMLIYQTGNNGSATLSASNETGKINYQYDFTNDSYSVAVLCGTKWTASLPVSDTSVDWMCNPYGEYLKECQLG